LSHDPNEITRSFKTHCFKCGTWNQVTVHRVPTDGDWDEAHPYICAGANSALNEASVFPSRRIAITDSHSGPGDAATSDGTGPINVATPSFRTRAIQSSGSETLLRIQFLAGCTIGMLESSIRKRQAYYNQARTHLALGKDAPLGRATQRSGVIVAIPILSGLHHQYVRI